METSDVQSLVINYSGEKKEEENFETKMDSLFNQLDEQFEKVKRYANIDVPLDQIELNQYKFRYDFKNDNYYNTYNNENLIEYNHNNEKKDNKDNNENIIIKEPKLEIKEIKDDEEIKKKMYDEIAYQRMEEERKIKEMEIEKKREKTLEEEKRIKEEQKKREEALIKKEKEIMKREKDLIKKEKEIEKKREEEEKRIKEERRRIEEEEEAVERSRMLKLEEEKLKKEEEDKEKEAKRESDRIKELRIQKEKKEEEEKKRKKLEEEKKKEMEKKIKEKELFEEEKLKEQINNNKINSSKNLEDNNNNDNDINEISIAEIGDSIEEMEEADSNNTQKNFKKNERGSTIKSINNESKDTPKLKEGKNLNLTNSRFNNKSINNMNKSRNKSISPGKKSQMKESTNKNMKKQKEEKKPEEDISKGKKEIINREDSEFVKKFKESKDYSKLSQEIINKILEYIYKIDDFDEENDEKEDINIFPSITAFDTDEKSLKEKIPEFEKKILEKDKLNADDRTRKYFSEEEAFDKNQENDKINDLISEIIDISNESHMEILQNNLDKEKLENLPLKDLEDLNDMEEIENKLFEKQDFYPDNEPIISNLENLTTFIYKFKDSAKEKPAIMINAIQTFNFWRASINDGNSFYRVIMFSLIEHCILKGDFQFLSYILGEISSNKFIEYYKEKKIEYNKPFLILSAILLMIQNKLEEKAHEYLLKAFNLKNGCFDMLLIYYLKKVLSNFGKDINKLLDEKKKSEENVDLIEEAKINIEQIENLYLDPPKINIFYLISSLFNINIKLYLLGGKYLEPVNLIKNIEHVDTSPTFIFGYFFTGYHILYNPDLDNDNEIFKSISENDNPQLIQLTHELKENKKCDICFKETEHIAFTKKKFIVCFSCLSNHIKEVIKKRCEYFFEEKCLGQEYYSRPIHLQDEFYIDDFDLAEISEEGNILNTIYMNNKSSKCIYCEKMKDEDIKLKTLECKCCICTDCFESIFMNLTNNYGYLLPCEVEMFNNKLRCKCGRMYTYNDLCSLYESNTEQKEKAKERLSLYKENYCLICMKNLLKELEIKKVKIRPEKEDDTDHYICEKCFYKHFKNEDLDFDSDEENNTKEENDEDDKKEKEKDKEKDKEVKVVKDEHKIKCSICQRWHHYLGSIDGCGCFIY